jgi:hypothetical protein
MDRALYEHTQQGWPMRLAFGAAALLLMTMGALQPLHSPALPRLALWLGAALVLSLGWWWSSLTVRIDGEALRARFGLGWPRATVRLADIATVEVTRTTFRSGWGVHRTRRGWLYNVAGLDAVIVTRKDGRAVLLGSDEPRKLKAALDRALAGSIRK